MDEQTVSLILPYQRANWLPQNSPELSQPAAGAGDGGFVHIWRGKDLLPRDGCMCLGVRNSLWIPESWVNTKTGCRKVKIITSVWTALVQTEKLWSSIVRPSSVPSRFLCPFTSVPEYLTLFCSPCSTLSSLLSEGSGISYRHFVWMSLTGFHTFIALQLSKVIFLYTLVLWDPYSNLAEVSNGRHYCCYTKEETEDRQVAVCKQPEIIQLVTDLGQEIWSFLW